MNDLKLASRVESYQKSSFDLKKQREAHSLKLRKDKINDIIMAKRVARIFPSSQKEFEDDSPLRPDEICKLTNATKEVKILFYKNILRNGKEEPERKKFALNKLYQMHEKITGKNVPSTLIDEEMLDLLLWELNTTEDYSVREVISFLLSSMTYYSDTLCKILSSKENLDLLYSLIIKNSGVSLMTNVLVIIGNLITYDRDFFIHNTSIFELLISLLIDKSIMNAEYAINLPTVIFWILNLLSEHCTNEELIKYNQFIPLTMQIFEKENLIKIKRQDERIQEELSQVLRFLLEISKEDLNIETMIKCNLCGSLIDMLEYVNISAKKIPPEVSDTMIVLTPENVSLCLKLIGNLFAIDNSFLLENRVISYPLLEIFENLILRYRFRVKEDTNVTIDLIWATSNLVGGPIEYTEMVVMRTRIPSLLFKYYNDCNDTATLVQLLYFIHNCLYTQNETIILEMLKLGVVHILSSTLSSSNKEIIILALECVKALIGFSSKLPQPSQMIVDLEKFSVLWKLENLTMNTNNKISDFANLLLEEINKINKY